MRKGKPAFLVSNPGVVASADVIVRSIIDLGRGLGMKVVAEGVETIDEAVFLVASGCTGIQGFLFGRPQPVSILQHGCDPKLMADLRRRLLLPQAENTALANLAARRDQEEGATAAGAVNGMMTTA